MLRDRCSASLIENRMWPIE